MTPLRIGILGAGNISKTMTKTLHQMEGVVPHAIASRDMTRAKAFAQEMNVEKAYGSYEELVQDPNIDLIYVATPHSSHAEHAMLCLHHDKPVLCEKAFTGNATQAKQVLDLAQQKSLFITEAVWPRYMPMYATLRKLIENGAIGKAQLLSASFGHPLSDVPRMTQPELAGGALLDLGVYPINFARNAFGNKIASVASTATLLPTGVDAQNSITLTYDDGRMASLTSTLLATTNKQGLIAGDSGYIIVENILNIEKIRVYTIDQKLVGEYQRPPQISGYEYEIQACIDALREGRRECPEMPHSETLQIMLLMDELRHHWGVHYPFD